MTTDPASPSSTWSRLRDRARADPRIPRALAGLGGVGLFASLVGEWLRMSLSYYVDGREVSELVRAPAPVTLADLGPYGTGWVLGVLTLLVCLTLAMAAGQPRVRAAARTTGQAVAVVLVGLLLVVGAVLTDPGLRDQLLVDPDLREALLTVRSPRELELVVSLGFGRGLAAALAGLALAGPALWLLGSVPATDSAADPAHDPAADPVAGPAADSAAGPGGPGASAAEPAPGPEPAAPGPPDLRVTAEPFDPREAGQEWR